MIRLEPDVWLTQAAAHEQRVEPWVAPRRERKRRGEKHPVDDFLFDYYPYSITRLRRWHPGYGVELLGDSTMLAPFVEQGDYRRTSDGVTVDNARLMKDAARLRLVHQLLSNTLRRDEPTNCFGMHEWAMVYGLEPDEVRHAGVPLRLAPAEIRSTVDDVGLRCTHLDAFRFFTSEATPRNAHPLSRERQPWDERAGCLHANMDLYKYAMWFSPCIGSALIADAFALARTAREVDMRAAPYDLRNFGYQPIQLETVEGRREYAREQRAIAEAADPIRRRLLTEAQRLLSVATSAAEPSRDSRSQPDPTPA